MKKTPEKVERPNFKSFGLSPSIYTAIEEAGFSEPTDVQLECIPHIMNSKDVLARAETGSGKTAAFVLPILERILRQKIAKQARNKPLDKSNVVGTLILVPTRELAIQIREEFERFSANIENKVKCLSVFGGVKINPQMIALRGGADVLVATPGRLLDLERNNAILLYQVQCLVVDEVDRLMKGDFEEEIDEIVAKLPKGRQNLMFSATFPPSIRKLVRRVMNEPEIINVDDLYDDVKTDQRVFTVNRNQKNDLLAHLLNTYDWKQILIFCSAKRTCDNLVKKLEKRGITAVAMHGNQHQYARANALKDFKAGTTRVLVATDVAGRGIDIGQLACVINYELPRSPNDYTHRIGRTGRAGEKGTAISLISHQEYQHFTVIEKRIGLQLEREQMEGFEADAVAPVIPEGDISKKKKKAKKGKRPALEKRKEIAKTAGAKKKPKAEKMTLEERKERYGTKPKPDFYDKSASSNKKSFEKETDSGSFYKKVDSIEAKPSSFKKPDSDSKYGKAERTDTQASKKSSDTKPSVTKTNDTKPSSSKSDSPKKVDTKPEGSSLYTRVLPKSKVEDKGND